MIFILPLLNNLQETSSTNLGACPRKRHFFFLLLNYTLAFFASTLIFMLLKLSVDIFSKLRFSAVLADCTQPEFFAYDGGSRCCDAETEADGTTPLAIGSTRCKTGVYNFLLCIINL